MITIRREGRGWDTYPAVNFSSIDAFQEWANDVGPRFLDTLRSQCPVNTRPHFVNTGRLLRSLRMETHTAEKNIRMEYTAATPYAAYVITGVRPHLITVRNALALHWWDRPTFGKEYFALVVMHGSRHPQQADPFHERAMDRDRESISNRFFDIVTDHLTHGLKE